MKIAQNEAGEIFFLRRLSAYETTDDRARLIVRGVVVATQVCNAPITSDYPGCVNYEGSAWEVTPGWRLIDERTAETLDLFGVVLAVRPQLPQKP